MGHSNRLFEIIQILRTSPVPVPARAFSELLEVSRRTIYRDIASLQASRVPIEGEAGVGYIMRPGYDLPPLMFSAEELEAIVVGISLIRRTGDKELQLAAARLFEKLADVVPKETLPHLNARHLHVSPWNPIPKSHVSFGLLRQAIRDEQKLRIRYNDGDGRSTSRHIQPITLIYYVDCVVLGAWCELRKAFRHFRTDRIRSCSKIDCYFLGDSPRLRREWRQLHPLFSLP